MCQKQCRDENGFKCHLTSESHQRQLLLFADNPDEYIDTFSRDFKDGYCELLNRRFGSKRVQCNVVYQEYIHDKDHIHMNSTQWETLTEFVKWLGREGIAKVDETEKGWYVQYIERTPEAIERQKNQDKKEKMTLDDEEKTAAFIEKQIQKAAAEEKLKPQVEYTELQRENEEDKVTLKLGITKKKEEPVKNPQNNALATFKVPESRTKVDKLGSSAVKRKSALEEIREMEEQKKAKLEKEKETVSHWLHKDIVVKIITKKLGDKYYKKKAFVKEVVDRYGAVIKVIDSGAKLKVDQDHLETVIPAIGKPVLLLKGVKRGYEGDLVEVNQKTFSCSVKLTEGHLRGETLHNIPYEDVSKLYVP
ncbi:unnamed protein product [Owenia fusiformis]|uniref:DNA/RNA-binding protein KIN17 n=1 Tax=Owenia fusiformis TaxID=6347 RepID=A0A8S4NUM6_OWEFU|nr:unnamed protein product [Owenia fusiformis]